MKGLRQRKIAALAVLALSAIHASGWSSDSRQALASEGRDTFCQIDDAGDLLGRLGERTPADAVKLVVSKQEVGPGVLVQARLINTTQIMARFGSEFKIQRYGPMGWKTDSISPDGPWPRRVGKLAPGRAAGCYRFAVPAGQGPGRYRFSTTVDLGSVKKARVAEFVVLDD